MSHETDSISKRAIKPTSLEILNLRKIISSERYVQKRANYRLSQLELKNGNEGVAISYAELASESNSPAPEYWVNYIRLLVDANC